jgi:hypothetical protein
MSFFFFFEQSAVFITEEPPQMGNTIWIRYKENKAPNIKLQTPIS